MSLELKSKGETTLPDIHGKATGVTINAQQLQICKQARGNESWRLFVNHYRLALFLDPKIEESFLKSTKCVDVRKLANMPLSSHPVKEADIETWPWRVPKNTIAGDVIVFVQGGTLPLVLRPKASRWSFIGLGFRTLLECED
jgi:hypothetical protein